MKIKNSVTKKKDNLDIEIVFFVFVMKFTSILCTHLECALLCEVMRLVLKRMRCFGVGCYIRRIHPLHAYNRDKIQMLLDIDLS